MNAAWQFPLQGAIKSDLQKKLGLSTNQEVCKLTTKKLNINTVFFCVALNLDKIRHSFVDTMSNIPLNLDKSTFYKFFYFNLQTLTNLQHVS